LSDTKNSFFGRLLGFLTGGFGSVQEFPKYKAYERAVSRHITSPIRMAIPFTGVRIFGKADNSKKRGRKVKMDSGDHEGL
jgi:hypothetical protein